MTLDTRIYVLDKIGHRDVFLKCNQLIGATENTRSTDKQDQSWRKGEPVEVPGNPWTISNKPGQGLPGWLMIHYRPDAPLRADEAAHDEDCEGEDDCSWNHRRACWLEVSIDTAYGYRGPEGGCGDLHARLVAELGQWLDTRGVRWQWKNEFTGEVHDRYDGLTDLGSGGAEASEWFRDIVTPAIQAGIEAPVQS